MLLQNASTWQVFGGNLLDVLEGKLYYLLQKCWTLYRFLNILLAIFLHENTLVKGQVWTRTNMAHSIRVYASWVTEPLRKIATDEHSSITG